MVLSVIGCGASIPSRRHTGSIDVRTTNPRGGLRTARASVALSRSVLEQPQHILGQRIVEALLHAKPTLALAGNPALARIRPFEPGPWLLGRLWLR